LIRLLAALACSLACALAHAQLSHTIAVVTLAGDARYAPRQVEKAYPGHPRGPLLAAVKLGLDDAQFELGEAKLNVVVKEYVVAGADKAGETIERLKRDRVQFVIIDAPESFVATFVPTPQLQAVIFNANLPADGLRSRFCGGSVFHTYPSTAMLNDALAQSLAARNWKDVLVVHGADDAALAQAWARSAKRAGLKTVDTRVFKVSSDPREREAANPRLLTNARGYDVVAVWDSEGEFARSLVFNTQLPRPTIGSNGLTAQAWHPQWERFGGPQLTRRFAKASGRPMTGHDWAAWVAVKAIANALLVAPNATAAQRIDTMRAATFSVDGFKGQKLTFRKWDGQLRQPILLSHADGVAAVAPLEGALHPTDVLDTLGIDESESACKGK
jgi:ABC transporter substrate binding protein (PQQ-dependent alcohol dehydrogenase system)